MLHYFAQRFYSRTMISPYVDNNTFKVYLVNEIPASQRHMARSTQPEKLRFADRNVKLSPNVFHMEQQSMEDTQSWTIGIKIHAWNKLSPLKEWQKQIPKVNILHLPSK